MKLNIKKLRATITAAIAFALIAAGSLFWGSKNAPMATAAWWNDSWLYRQAIPVTNNTNAEADVYISVTLDTNTASTSMQADCGDFRFTKEDGTVLPYYIVSGCRTATNVIHVSFDSFPAGAQTVYFYYGNATAENGFSEADFTTEASDYTIGAVQTVEAGPGPVGYWSFDEGYGSTAHDESGQGNDGTITGAVWKPESECISGKCLFYDGSGDSTAISNFQFPAPDQFSISQFVNFKSFNASSTIIGQWGNNQNNILIGLDGTNNSQIRACIASGLTDNCANYGVTADAGISANKWHNIQVYYDGSQSGNSGKLKIYIDGIEKNLNFGGTIPSSIQSASTQSLKIGSLGTMAVFSNVLIDEVKIYPYARTAEQIKEDYNSGLAGQNTSQGAAVAFGSASDKWLTDGLAGYWKFDESATTSGALDSSGNGKTGVFNGDASTTVGKFGNGGIFDGTGDYIYVGEFDEYAPDGFTMAAWVKLPSGLSDINYAVMGRGYSEPRLYVYNDLIGISAGNCSANGVAGFTVIADIRDGIWHHVAGMIRPNEQSMDIYLDGVKMGSQTDPDIENCIGRDSQDDLAIGRRGAASDSYFNGRIDEARVYYRALQPGEVRKLYEFAPGPVAHWKFDEKSGTAAYDSVASSSTAGGNDATLGGDGAGTDVPAWAKGKYGGALQFDGIDDYAGLGSSPKLSSRQGTVSFWMKHTAWTSTVGDLMQIYQNGGVYNEYLRFYYNGTSHTLSITAEDNNVEVLTRGYDLDNLDGGFRERWYHIAWTQDGSSPKLFIDGLEKTLGGTDGGYWTNHFSVDNITIGKSVWGEFGGLIDDIRIYNYVRTQKQIMEDMNGGAPAAKSPVLHLSFDEGYGGTAYDSTPYGNNGTLDSGGSGGNSTVTAMWDKGGKIKGGMEFDGTNDHIDMGGVILGNISEYTISAWIKNNSAGTGGQTVFMENNSSGGNNSIYIKVNENVNGDVEFGEIGASGWIALNPGATSINDNDWHHILAIRENSDFYLYIDGALKDSGSATIGTRSPNLTYIGAQYNLGDRFPGLIDELKLWNFALNQDEIKTEYILGQAAVMGEDASRSNDGTAVNGAGKEYCIPGDTAQCDKPVLELKMDENGGTTTYDTSGNGLDGIAYDGANNTGMDCSEPGKFGSACDFDGIDDYVEVVSTAGDPLDIDGDMTLSLWFKADNWTNTGYDLLARKHVNTDSAYNYEIIWNASGNSLRFVSKDGTDASDDIAYVSKPTTGVWHHVAGVRSGTTLQMYIDGVRGTDGTTGTSNTGIGNFHLGTIMTTSSFFDGIIDDVKVYDYARTPAQIAWDYNRGKPVAHWRFDECQGSTIHDYQGANHGTLNLGASGVTSTGTCASSSDSFWYNGRSGKYNAGGSFDGTDDYVTLPFTGGENNIEDQAMFTLSGWFKASSAISSERIIYSEKNSADGSSLNLLQINDDGQKGVLTWSQRDNADYRADLTYDGGLSDDSWHHFAIIRNGSNAKMYVDGKLADESDDFSFGAFTFDSALLGAQKNGTSAWSGFFQGLLDDIKTNDNALTAEQVRQEYNGGSVRFGE